VRFAPLVVLFFWLPVLAVAVLLTRHTIWLWLPLLFIMAGLVRLAVRQLRASRYRLYHHPPYSGTVARLAIELRQREVLRSLHKAAPDVVFFTEVDRAVKPADTGPRERGRAAQDSSPSLTSSGLT
jgi:hypothetical protein